MAEDWQALEMRVKRRTQGTAALLAVSALAGSVALHCPCHAENIGSRDCRVASAEANARAGAPHANSKPHRVRLSWDASVPASRAPLDAIQGYFIERKEVGKDKSFRTINLVPIPETSCTDYAVAANHTYIYRTKAISYRRLVSGPSNEAKATILPH